MRYPRWKYHRTLPPRIVEDPGEEAELGLGWEDSPAAFYGAATPRSMWPAGFAPLPEPEPGPSTEFAPHPAEGGQEACPGPEPESPIASGEPAAEPRMASAPTVGNPPKAGESQPKRKRR